MIYSSTDILAGIEAGTIKISPYSDEQLGTNSYDLRLGNIFYEVFWDADGPYYVGPYIYNDGDKVYIPVSGTLLGMTKESVGTSGKVVAELRSRSTTRRKGSTTNIDAGLGDIGYDDIWTIELTAFVSHSLFMDILSKISRFLIGEGIMIGALQKFILETINQPYLVVGEKVAQMVFFECKSPPTKEYDGQYQVDWPLNMIPKDSRHRVFEPQGR